LTITAEETFLYEHQTKSSPELNIWCAFPGIYNFGMSALGYMAIFKMLDLQKKYFVERIFSDTNPDETKLRATDIDIFTFSMSFEFDFLTVFKILEKFEIPLKAKDRNENHPLIFAGGPVVSANPEPFCEFFDIIMPGDGENIVEIMDCIKDNKSLPRKELFQKLDALNTTVYIPSLTEYNPITHEVTKNGKKFEIKKNCVPLANCISTPILTEQSYFSNTYIIELVRGCPQRCGFCLASYLNLPVRFASYEQIIQAIDNGLKHTEKIAFLGALIAAHPRFDDIFKYIYDKIQSGTNIELSVSSLRADSISPQVVKTLVAAGQKHTTIAIEAGSDRLRKVINKNLTEEQILKTARIARENGLKGLKIYAMIGLPTETQQDLQEMVELAKKLKKENKGFDLTFSFASFVPKAHTPFQFCPRESTKSLEKKYEYIKKQFHSLGIKARCSSVKWDYIQAIFSRGDRRLNEYAQRVYRDVGNIGSFKTIYKQMKKEKLLPEPDYYALREIPFDEITPWDYIKTFTAKEDLIRENKRLLGKND